MQGPEQRFNAKSKAKTKTSRLFCKYHKQYKRKGDGEKNRKIKTKATTPATAKTKGYRTSKCQGKSKRIHAKIALKQSEDCKQKETGANNTRKSNREKDVERKKNAKKNAKQNKSKSKQDSANANASAKTKGGRGQTL